MNLNDWNVISFQCKTNIVHWYRVVCFIVGHHSKDIGVSISLFLNQTIYLFPYISLFKFIFFLSNLGGGMGGTLALVWHFRKFTRMRFSSKLENTQGLKTIGSMGAELLGKNLTTRKVYRCRHNFKHLNWYLVHWHELILFQIL